MNRDIDKLYTAYSLCGELFLLSEFPEAIDKALEELRRLRNYYELEKIIDKEYVIYE
jgi:hypothetical protein